MKTEAFLYDEFYRTLNEAPVREGVVVDVEAFVTQYAPLVRRLAHQMIAKLPANVELDDMIQAFRKVERLAASPDHIIPGHDPLVMQLYPAPKPALEGVIVRLDVMPTPRNEAAPP